MTKANEVTLLGSLLGVTLFLSACNTFTTTTDSASATIKATSKTTSSTSEVFGSDGSKAAFIEQRFDAIRAEAARGAGENLDSLATLLGEANRDEFSRWMKTNYTLLFSDLETPAALLTRIEHYRGEHYRGSKG